MNIDKEFERTIDAWIEGNKESYLKDLASLIKIKSVSKAGEDGYPYGKGCHDVLVKASGIATSYGFSVENPEDKYLLINYGEQEGKKIGIFNHMDVVPEGEGWENPPYELTQKDGFLIGRGVADNKGAGVASLYALRYLKEHGIALKHPVTLFYGAAEETTMDDIESFKKTKGAPEFAFVPDTNFPVCHGEKGNMRFSISISVDPNVVVELKAGDVINAVPSYALAMLNGEFEVSGNNIKVTVEDGKTKIEAAGTAGHAAFPEQSDNAVRTLFSALRGISGLSGYVRACFERLYRAVEFDYGEGLGIDCSDEASGRLTSMGTILRYQDGKVRLSFDTRTPVTISVDEIDAKLRAFAADNGFEYELESSSTPSYTPLDSDVVTLLCDIASHIYGPNLKPYTMGGGTYCRKLPFALGFGPGIPNAPNLYSNGKGNGHQSDECILLSLLLTDIKAAVLALIGLDKIIE